MPPIYISIRYDGHYLNMCYIESKKRISKGAMGLSVIPYIFVLLGAILWGTTGTAQTFLPENAHPFRN